MAWLLAIYFIPLIGVFLFLLIGNPRLPRKRRRKQEQINTYIHDTSEHLDFGTLRPHAPDWFTSMVTLNRNLGAMPLAGDNAAHLISDYQQSLDAMADAIRGAERYVHIEFYILQTDEATDNLFRALEEVAARGVTVRVLLDHWANRGKPFYKKTLKRLDAMGAQWHLMLPVQPFKGKYQRPDLRNHRKLLVIDGSRGVHGLAERHRLHVQPQEEHQARAALGRPHGAARGAGRGIRQRGLPVGLVQRDRRDPHR